MRKGLGIAIIAFLSACATTPEPEAEAPIEEPAAPVVDVEPTPPPPPAPPPLPDPDTLLFKRPHEIATLLGEPQLIRWENEAQVFQYSAQDCVLDLVFFERGENGFTLNYYESRARLDGTKSDAAICLDKLLKAREGA